jgi:NADH:ubiquinone oxidoreductase subunit 2 (subunit N)
LIPSPALLFFGPLILAIPVYLLARRWPAAAGLVAAAGILLLRAALASVPADMMEWAFFERVLSLSDGLRQALLYLYGLLALLLFLSVLYPQGADFAPGALVAISFLGVSLVLGQFIFGVALWFIAAGVTTAVLQAGRSGSTTGSLRYLLMTTLAAAFLLLAGWLLAGGASAFSELAWRLLLIGLVIALAGFPFIIWVRPIVSESAPLAALFAFGPAQFVLLLLAGGVIAAYPALMQQPQFSSLLRLAAGGTIAVSALLAFSSTDWGRLLGYVLLADMGAVMLVISAGAEGLLIAFSLLLMRIVSLLAAGLGLTILRQQAGTKESGQQADSFAGARGLARRHPPAAALLILGVLSLAGFPLTPGFSARWMAVSLTATSSPVYAMLLVVAGASAVVGTLRALRLLVQQPDEESIPYLARFRQASRTEQVRQIALVLALIIFAFLIFFPQTTLALVPRLAVPGY